MKRSIIKTAALAAVEALEGRLLLSAVTLDSGTLLVQGDAATPNRIILTVNRGSLRVIDNRLSRTFPLAGITDVHIIGGAKNDVIQVGAGLKVSTEIDGMGGNDRITGGTQPGLIITGAGKSIVTPGSGLNYVDVTLGINVVNLAGGRLRQPADIIVAKPSDIIRGRMAQTQVFSPSVAPASPIMRWSRKVAPTLTATASETAGGVIGIALLSDSVTLSGGKTPTGTLTFTLTAPDGSIADTETITVTGNGAYSTSNTVIATQVGTYTWNANYSGDGKNFPAADNGPGQSLPADVRPTPQIIATASETAGGVIDFALLSDAVTIAGGVNPTGTLTFTLTAPDGSIAGSEIVAVIGNGAYATSHTILATQVGTYRWHAGYSGDAINNPAADNGSGQSLAAVRATPQLAATASETAGGVVGIALLSNTVTLTGGNHPTGQLTFTLNAPDGSVADMETVTVTGNGAYATSHIVIAGQVGTYLWRTSYSGDGKNSPATNNGSGQPLAAVRATPQIASTATETDGNLVYTSLLTDSATITGGNHPTGQLTFTLTAPDGSIADSETVTVTGDGTYATSNTVIAAQAGTYIWLATYSGDALNNPNQSLAMPPIPTLPPPPSSTPPVLAPKIGGFTGPTTVPQTVATGFAADAKAIARWDVVPYQTFTSTFNVGVVAFHSNGIARVEFSVNGGPWAAVTQMSLNPLTNVTEYWATLDATRFAADGQVEVRAIVYPTVGLPRVLAGPMTSSDNGQESLLLNANGHGTLPQLARYVAKTGSDTTGDGSAARPFATIFKAALSIQAASGGLRAADNGMIYLMPGSYGYADRVANGGYAAPEPITKCGWLTIAAAPGVFASQVNISSSGSNQCLSTKLVHFQNVTITSGLSSPNNLNACIWFDRCMLTGTGPGDDITFAGPTSWTGGIFVTDTTIQNVVDAMNGSTLERNVTVLNIASDAFMDAHVLINCTVQGMLKPTGSPYHPDVLQLSGSTFANVVFYGVTAVININAQGLFGDPWTGTAIQDAAFVNVRMNNQTTGISPDYQVFLFCCPVNNMLIQDSAFVGPAYWNPNLGFVGSDIVVANTTFSAPPNPVAGVLYE